MLYILLNAWATAHLLNSVGDYTFFHQNGSLNVEFEPDKSNIAKETCKRKVDAKYHENDPIV